MQLVLEIKNANELQLLLQYIRHLQSVEIVQPPADKNAPARRESKPSFFDTWYGSLKPATSPYEMDVRLQKLRQEWERDTW
jgi:hypothetical protein